MSYLDQDLDCLIDAAEAPRPVMPVRPAGLADLLASLPAAQARFLEQTGFGAKPQEIAILAGEQGIEAAVLGLGDSRAPSAFGQLALRLPESVTWRLAGGDYDPDAALLGYCLGAYQQRAFKSPERGAARLVIAGGHAARQQAAAAWMVRDLINAPANILGPVELADCAMALAARHAAPATLIEGAALQEAYPAVATVGQGSARPPRVVVFHWAGSAAAADAPLLSLCGKGVCFDTGGYDLKPSAGMLRMKKDMGGAAITLGLARLIMEADLPIRLAVRVGCVENSVSGTAMRPLDVIRTRAGLTVEVGNTDAEGRLVLCDLLADAAEEHPALLVDFATLTGAARVGLGPDLPALFCTDDGWADALLRAGTDTDDPLWRLPLWPGYAPWLKSPTADLNSVASKPFAGAIVAALFLQRFVPAGLPWAHVDVYAWNDQTQPARPEGGEAQAMRAMFAGVQARLGAPAMGR